MPTVVYRVLPKREKKHRTPESAHTENTEPRPRWWRCAEKNMGKELVGVLKALTDHLEKKRTDSILLVIGKIVAMALL